MTGMPAEELPLRDHLPEQIWTWQNHPDHGFWRGTPPRQGEQRHDYVRADLVAAKDAEIARLRGLLKARDRNWHDMSCGTHGGPSITVSPCTCGHDAVAAYFSEIEG